MKLYPQLEEYLQTIESTAVEAERKPALAAVAHFLEQKLESGKNPQLVFICTHNSRRSQLAEFWAAAIAYRMNVPVKTFSGGTSATAFYPEAIAALERAGCKVQKPEGENSKVTLQFSDSTSPKIQFSKVFDDPSNPSDEFAAVMTCSDAEENCPFVTGAEKRFSLNYEDPKKYDQSDRKAAAYDQRCAQIAREMLYIFLNR